MKNQIGNRDKRVAILLIIAFAWLFIGSLVIFHEEHVLGRHFSLTSQLFISPKSNDKQLLTPKLQQPVQGFHNQDDAVALLSNSFQDSYFEYSTRIIFTETSVGYSDAVYLAYLPLRAPPAL
jgi:hypothetical protein